MEEIRFRQAIFREGKFHHWHHWGYVGYQDEFVAPITICQQSWNKTYEVKPDQQYTGLRCGPISIGNRLYEGDRVQAYYTQTGYSQIYDVYFFQGAWEPFSGNCDSDHTDRYRIVGNIYQGILEVHSEGSLER